MAPDLLNDPTPKNAASTTNLLARIPSTTALIQRTQTTLGLLHEVVQESSAEYWYGRGRAAEAVEQWTEAAYAYKQCVERDAKYWRGTARLAGALGYLGQPELAVWELRKVATAWDALVAELPQLTWQTLRDRLEVARGTANNGFALLMGLAKVYSALKQGDEARRMLEEIRFTYNFFALSSLDWFCLSGDLHSEAGFNIEAIADYNCAVQINPYASNIYHERGVCKGKLGDYSGAITDYARVIELNPGHVFAYINQAVSYFNLKDYTKAVAILDYAVTIAPNNATAYLNLGIACSKLEDYAKAVNSYDISIKLEPNNAFTHRNRALIKADIMKDYVGAISDYDRAIELEPENAIAYFNRAGANVKLFKYGEAIADLDKAIRLKPAAVAYNRRGVAKHNSKDYVGAIADYDWVIVMSPNDATTYLNRAKCKEKLGDTAGAEADRQRAAQLTVSKEAN